MRTSIEAKGALGADVADRRVGERDPSGSPVAWLVRISSSCGGSGWAGVRGSSARAFIVSTTCACASASDSSPVDAPRLFGGRGPVAKGDLGVVLHRSRVGRGVGLRGRAVRQFERIERRHRVGETGRRHRQGRLETREGARLDHLLVADLDRGRDLVGLFVRDDVDRAQEAVPLAGVDALFRRSRRGGGGSEFWRLGKIRTGCRDRNRAPRRSARRRSSPVSAAPASHRQRSAPAFGAVEPVVAEPDWRLDAQFDPTMRAVAARRRTRKSGGHCRQGLSISLCLCSSRKLALGLNVTVTFEVATADAGPSARQAMIPPLTLHARNRGDFAGRRESRGGSAAVTSALRQFFKKVFDSECRACLYARTPTALPRFAADFVIWIRMINDRTSHLLRGGDGEVLVVFCLPSGPCRWSRGWTSGER